MNRTGIAPLLLGIDIGTTSLAAQVIDSDSGACVQTYSIPHNAGISLPDYPDAYAADAELLTERAKALVESAITAYPAIAALGVTGQMHGIVCIDEKNEILSPLYTWQNQFGLRQMGGAAAPTVCDEIERICQEKIPTGYGIVTYYALRKFGLLPQNTAKIVTIMDLLVTKLTATAPVIHPTNAAAWGAYDLEHRTFKHDVLEKLNIPLSVLPEVVGDYFCPGHYTVGGRKIPVSASIGDNQAGLFGALADDNMILINVGTSSQVSFLSDRPRDGGEVRPYFDGKFALSGAALCGGRAYAILAKFVRSIAMGLGAEVSEDAVYDYLNDAARCGCVQSDPLTVSTEFGGTRADPNRRGSISGIGTENFTPEALSAGFLRGIIEELYQMYRAMRQDASEDTAPIPVIGGNAMRRNPVLQNICGEYFRRTPLLPLHTEEAAFGAALYGGIAAGLLTREESYTRIQYQTNHGEISLY